MGAPLGNQNARKENRLVRETLKRLAVQNPDKLRAACEKLLDAASGGDLSAFKEFRDTLDGRPTQAIVGGDEDDNPIQHSVTLKFVDGE